MSAMNVLDTYLRYCAWIRGLIQGRIKRVGGPQHKDPTSKVFF